MLSRRSQRSTLLGSGVGLLAVFYQHLLTCFRNARPILLKTRQHHHVPALYRLRAIPFHAGATCRLILRRPAALGKSRPRRCDCQGEYEDRTCHDGSRVALDNSRCPPLFRDSRMFIDGPAVFKIALRHQRIPLSAPRLRSERMGLATVVPGHGGATRPIKLG